MCVSKFGVVLFSCVPILLLILRLHLLLLLLLLLLPLLLLLLIIGRLEGSTAASRGDNAQE